MSAKLLQIQEETADAEDNLRARTGALGFRGLGFRVRFKGVLGFGACDLGLCFVGLSPAA